MALVIKKAFAFTLSLKVIVPAWAIVMDGMLFSPTLPKTVIVFAAAFGTENVIVCSPLRVEFKAMLPLVEERVVSVPKETVPLYFCPLVVVIDAELIATEPFTSRKVRFVVVPTSPIKVVLEFEVSFNACAPSTVETKIMSSIEVRLVSVPRETALL